MALAGLSTLGIEFAWAPETTANTKPDTGFKTLTRINSIDGISITPETIDASALEDYIERTIAGRASTGGTWNVTVNFTQDTRTEWEAVQNSYVGGARIWFQVIIPELADAFFVVAQPPRNLPLPSMGQNELLTMEIALTIESYEGLSTKVAPTP